MKKTKLNNVVFPLWFILILPPILFLVLPCNFIIDSLVLLLSFKILKRTDKWNQYKKTILKVWIIGFLVDIMGSLLLLITQFLPDTKFLYEQITYPIVWNPFKSIWAIIYIVIVIALCGFLIYILNNKISLKKTDFDKKQKHFISLLLALFTAPYLFLLPTSLIYNTKGNNSLQNYQNTLVGDASNVGGIVNLLESGNYKQELRLITKEKPYGIMIVYKNGEYNDIYKDLERDASIMFNLITNVENIFFQVNDKTYTFTYEQINKLYNSELREIKIEKINERYSKEQFKSYPYYGNVFGYDIFDTSDICSTKKETLWADKEYQYTITCNEIKNIVAWKYDKKIDIKTALTEGKLTIEQLLTTQLPISKEKLK